MGVKEARVDGMTIDVEEALRCLGAAGADEKTRRDVEQAARDMESWCYPRFVWRAFSMEKRENEVRLPEAGVVLTGKLASQMLTDCEKAALLVCTLGAEFDRRLRAVQARDMARAVLLDACGSACVEAACDSAEKEIAARYPGMYLTDRFSPGYGDLPLTLQPSLLRAADAEKRLGVYAAPSCMLLPVKTVTAVIGLSVRPQAARIRGCAFCALREGCAYRKRGNTCGNPA